MRPLHTPFLQAMGLVPALILVLIVVVSHTTEAQLRSGQPHGTRTEVDTTVRRDRELAQVHFREAYSLYRDGRLEDAVTVARKGLDFSEDDSDLHALIGLVYGRAVESTSDALVAFERAFACNRFTSLTPTEMAAEYAAVLQRIGRHGRVVALIQSLRVDTMLHPDLLYRQARALFELDRTAEGEARASLGVRVYLDDPRFYRLLLERRPVAGYRDYLATRRYENESEDYLRLLLTYVERTARSQHREQVLQRYFDLGGADPIASLLLLEQSEDAAAEFARFRNLGGVREQDLLRRAVPLLDPATRAELINEMRSFDGELIIDRDRNGIAEDRMEFSGGELLRWRVDRNQDGTVEYDIQFSGGWPVHVEHEGSAGFRALQWSIYPEVRSIRFASPPEHDEVYHLIGERLEVLLIDPEALDPEALDSSAADAEAAAANGANAGAAANDTGNDLLPHALRHWELHPQAVLLDRATVAPQAAFVERVRPAEDRPFRVTELSDGVPVRWVEDTIGDGAVDYVVLFRDGRPHEAMRDLLGDGNFDVLEEFEDGELRRITVTAAEADVERFYQEFGEIEIRSWDFDRDGNPDVQERYFRGDPVLRQYSGEVPGVFDLSIDFLGDILE